MNTFLSIFKMECLLYRRSLYLWITLAILTGYLFLGYRAYLSVELDVGQFLQSSGYIGMAASIIGLLMGMLAARREHIQGMAETLSAIPGDSIRAAAKLFAWTFVALLFTLVAAVEMLALVLFVNSEFISFWPMLVGYIFLYWGMTLLVCGYIGYAIETLFPSRWWTLILLFISWILISPINYFLLMIIPSAEVIQTLSPPLSLLNQGERSLEMIYEEMDGLHISKYVWLKKSIFFLFTIALVCAAKWNQKHREQTKTERRASITIAALCIVISAAIAPAALSPLDNKLLQNYEMVYEQEDRTFYESPPTIEPNSNWRYVHVDTYTVDLEHVSNQIQYSLVMDLTIENSGNPLPFTLYHGLRASSLRINGKAVNWEQTGDFLTVSLPEVVNHAQLSMNISGHTGALHPIKNQSFFLAGDFPWLPIAGIYPIAEISKFSGQLYYRSIRTETESMYHINVHDSQKIYSNLPQTADNVFSGRALGPFLLSGIVLDRLDNGKQVVHPPDRLQQLNDILPTLQQNLNVTAELLGEEPLNIMNELQNVWVVPFYSYESEYRMKYVDGKLYLNEKFGKSNFLASVHYPSVFYTFYWNNEYREQDSYHAFILSALVEYLSMPDDFTLIKRIEEDMELRPLEMDDPVYQFLLQVFNAYESGKEEAINKLLKQAYQTLNQQKWTMDNWSKLLSDILHEEERHG